MKKSLFILLILTLVSGAYAQKIKFIQGISLSRYAVQPTRYHDPWWGIDSDYRPEYIRGLIIGVGAEFVLSENLSLEIDQLYFQKGSRVEAENLLYPFNFKLDVMSFPVLFKIRPPSGPPIYFLGGGEFSITLSHGGYTEETRMFEWGVVLGYGFDIKISEKLFCMEMRYHFGLNNILKENLQYFTSIKTNGFAFILGFDI